MRIHIFTQTNKGTEPTRKCPSVAKHRVTDANYVHTVYFCSFKFPTNTQKSNYNDYHDQLQKKRRKK